MAAYNKFNGFGLDVAQKVHNLGSDTLKLVLSNTAPVATNTVIGNITQIANGNGYTTGGAAVTTSSSTQTSGVYKLVLADVTWTASGGSIGPFRYVVLYNSTAALSQLISWWDYGSSITVPDGSSFTADFDPTTGALTIT